MTEMTSRERLMTALENGKPDRLPVTTHHVMPYWLNKTLGGIETQEFFERFNFDAIQWVTPHRPDPDAGEYPDPNQAKPGFLESTRVATDDWQIVSEPVEDPRYTSTRFRFITPKGELSMVLSANDQTGWVTEHLIKQKKDIDIIGEFVTHPKCDVEAVNAAAEAFGDRGITRGHVCCFDVFGQPGCWQDACCLAGSEAMIMHGCEDPEWVHAFLEILMERKRTYLASMKGARYDVLELGGGDASTTVISPSFFDQFVAPYDAKLIETAHEAGQRIVYHTCGGMMPILEKIADMNPDAMETFTPAAMGGDADLAEAKRRIGERVCMIGGFDQNRFFTTASPEETQAEVHRCFEAAGKDGGFILAPSDHFFEAGPELIEGFVDAARECTYE